MTSIPVATPRRHRLRTGLVLATAAAAAIGAALLAQRPRPRPAAPPPRTAEGLVVGLTSSHVLAGASETYLAVALTAPAADLARRTPASLAIVIDRSGSMEGEALAQAKAAALTLIDRLAPDDEASLISYSSDVTIDVPLTMADAAGKAALRAAVDRLVARGDTGISAALWAGTDELRRSTRDVRRVVLLSDGKPTDGITRPSELIRFAATRAAQGVSISAVGLGVEYNEHVMAGIASAGRGNYYYVERGTALADMFVRELDSLGQTVIAAGEVLVTAAPGVTIVGVLGYPFERDSAGVVRVPVSDLRAGQHAKVVVRLRTELAATATVDVAAVTWRYRLVGGGQVERTADARATVTTDAALVARGRDGAIVRMVEEARTAMAIDEAAGAYAEGDIDRAQTILRVRTTEASATAADLGDAELDRKVRRYTGAAQANFAAPPASAAAGKGGVKAQRAEAYELVR
ncbi:MAG: VWA domain-containing protein [Myxococcales bacterium]|nr:VWA domain-containing protein [Myxococcales bacterium]